MANPGIAPPVPGTPVGDFRAVAADTQYVPLDPPVSGQGDYTYWSDASIESFIALGKGSTFRALGYAIMEQATQAARESESVVDHDLRIDLTKKAADLREQAAFYFAEADMEDLSGEDAFTVVRIGGGCGKCPPELAGHYACQHCGWRW